MVINEMVLLNKWSQYFWIILSLIILYGALTEANSQVSDKPNIIYILADDLGYGDIRSLNPNSKIPTPNIDRLANGGITFSDAHSSSSVCSPTRYGVLTGRYSWRSSRQGGALWPFATPLIEEGRLTLPKFLKNNDYNTACIGKWHLGMNWIDNYGNILEYTGAEKGFNIDFTKPIKNGPITKGFDYFFGTDAPNYPPYCFIENEKTIGIPSVLKPDSIFGNSGIMLENWDLYKVLPEIEKRALNYINLMVSSESPFFLYLPLTAPHTPIAPNEEYLGKSKAGAYGDFVYQIDAIVGQIIKTLETQNKLENTLIVFTSDNGSPGRDGTNMSGATSSVKKYGHNPSHVFRGIKSDIWEGGHHIPFFAHWPNKIKPNTTSDEIICLTDMLATCAAILNVELPNNAGEDSFNILPILTGEKFNNPIRGATVHLSEDGSFAIRQGKWKLILCPGSGGWSLSPERALRDSLLMVQLYDLSTDIGEENNVSNSYPEIVYQLTNLLNKYVGQGRSTPGLPQKNTGEPDIWKFLEVRKVKYNTSLVEHLAAEKEIISLNNAIIKFANGGINVLADGIRASSRFDDGYWAGVEGEDINVLIDLTVNTSVRKVSIGFLESQSHWIFLPTKIEVSLSKDGEKFYSNKSINSGEAILNENREIKEISIKFDNEVCRYIKIKAKSVNICPLWHKGAGGKAWLFSDEIIVE